MLEYLNFCLLCAIFASIFYLYIRIKKYFPILKMAEELIGNLGYGAPQSDTKRQKLLECILTRNSKLYLGKVYTEEQLAKLSEEELEKLDLTFIIDSGGKLSTRLYDKRDDFDFHIVNFPFLSSNIPSGPSYGVYISQLLRYARCCSHYDDFRYRHKCLVDRLLSQGYKALRLEKSFKKFYGRYQDLTEKYQRSVNAMVSDSFPAQFPFNM